LIAALAIWGALHAFNMLAYVLTMKGSSREFHISLSLISLMGGSALMWTGHTSWFLGLNLAVVGALILAAFALIGISPPSLKNHDASDVAKSAALRFAVALACWFLAK
jgi:hypothetical protein